MILTITPLDFLGEKYKYNSLAKLSYGNSKKDPVENLCHELDSASKKGFRVASLEDAVGIANELDKLNLNEHLLQYYVKESIIINPKKGIYLAKSSPILDENVHTLQLEEDSGYLTDAQFNKLLPGLVEIINSSDMNQKIEKIKYYWNNCQTRENFCPEFCYNNFDFIINIPSDEIMKYLEKQLSVVLPISINRPPERELRSSSKSFDDNCVISWRNGGVPYLLINENFKPKGKFDRLAVRNALVRAQIENESIHNIFSILDN